VRRFIEVGFVLVYVLLNLRVTRKDNLSCH